MPLGRKLLGTSATALIAGLVVVGSALAQGTTKTVGTCNEREPTRPARSGAKNLIELQTNKIRPTFDVGLADKSDGTDSISFSPKAGEVIGARIAAEVVDIPRFNKHPLRGQIFIAAHPSKSSRAAVVEACFERNDRWPYTAGTYEGTIRVYGPRVADFTYALVVTTKWPWWFAVLVIAATVAFSVIVFVLLPRVPTPTVKKDGKTWLTVVLGVGVAIVLAALTYWSQYETNDTWGSDPQAQILALAMAAFGATVLGYAAVESAQRQIAGEGRSHQQRT